MKSSASCLFAAAALLTLTPAIRAQTTATLTSLHNFTGSEGLYPHGGLVQGRDGNFYGTAYGGGKNNGGTVFSITPAGVLTTLHTFNGGTDGGSPFGALVQGSDGDFYGTTGSTVFSITPAGALTTLHTLGRKDGSASQAALIQGRDGNFYGTTETGDGSYEGTVFSITPAGAFTVLHTFSTVDGNNANGDGANPEGALTQDSDGNFYGTTFVGGSGGSGTVFKITPAGALTTVYTFSAIDAKGINGDGAYPASGLVHGRDGNFYGTALFGGGSGSGTVFRITPAGAFTTLHSFSALDGNLYNSDGAVPEASLVQDRDGDFYGTTNKGGSNGNGTIFQITPAGVFGTLYTFSAEDGSGDNGDGAVPGAPLVQGSDGNFYGTTNQGGGGGGTVFELTLYPAFFSGEAVLSDGVYYLAFSNGNYFGYYSFLNDPNYLYHFDLGYEYAFDANDGKAGVYLYDFASRTFWYTSPTFSFPYLYDFSLNSVVYYFPDPDDAGHYNTKGVRYFYVFRTGQVISK